MQLIKLERQKGVGTKLQINGSVAGWIIAVLMFCVSSILVEISEGSILLEIIGYSTRVIFITATMFVGLLATINILRRENR
jgi:hypothetical protein